AGPGKFEEARHQTEELVAFLSKVYGEGHWKYATGLDSLARYNLLLGDHDAALSHLERARDVLVKAGATDTSVYAHVESAMGKSLFHLLRVPEAEAHFRRAIEIEERQGRPNNQRLVIPLYNLGRTLAEQGKPEEAERSIQRAIDIHLVVLPRTNPHFWEFDAALAGAELAQGKTSTAIARLEPILKIEEATHTSWFADAELLMAKALTAAHRD